MVAGETSGDLLAGLLLDGMKQRWPDLHSAGIGGPQMAKRGFEAWWPHDKLTVHGLGWDVLLRYREIVGIRNQLKTRLLANKPDVFIGVDAPDFNLDLEAALKAQGVKTVHFVCPSVWAWRPERLEKIKRSVDHVLCLFPFEPALLAQHGIAATYVGHPLAQVIPIHPDRAQARVQLGLRPDAPVVAILPGSRVSEVRHLVEVFFQAAALIQKGQPATQFIVPAVPLVKPQIMAAVQASGLGQAVQVLDGQSHAALAACDVTLIASGTATLEAALFKRPMVIAYRMGALSWRLMRRKRLQPWVGLPNILCREFVVPELLQDAATPSALAHEILAWLACAARQPEKIRQLEQRFSALHTELRRDTPTLAVHAIAQLLQN
ncbi:MAG: lipid-A-disaccharide synthase [Comamonadaceae bacterium CG1_02_60_18]|nr:MAG: lipid-A-disaccharide synthase [Comamonadaceae bacterium CG1_02_60_18]PIQ52693.1 MAG: lipid-A-disaccharide synthase [Comamonadaceae bacterium CG12_big_fil_rev_8_21_14_0_65_59_15]